MPKVSVIIPNYNHAKFLKQRIESVLNQTYQDFELILLDDSSTDNSKEIIELYRNDSKVSNIIYNINNGSSPFKQWNKGIDLACGEWIWIAESDDFAEITFLEELIDLTYIHVDVGFIYTLHNLVNEDGNKIIEVLEDYDIRKYSGKEFILNKMLYKNSISNVSNTIFKKDFFLRIKPTLYQNMMLCGDWFFYVQILEHTNILSYNKLLNNYRLHKNNVSSMVEVAGASSLEGIEVLDYIANIFELSPFFYSYRYAKRLLDLRRTYNYSREVNLKIVNRYSKNHKLILLYYYLLLGYRFIKNI